MYQANAIATQAHQINLLRDAIADGMGTEEAAEFLTRTVRLIGHLVPEIGTQVVATVADLD